MQEITNNRGNPLIDPSLHAWHYEVPAYLFLGGVVAGVMILTGLWMLWKPNEDRSRGFALAPWASPVLLSIGMLFLWLDLEDRLNAWRFYMVLKPTSPMSWGSWILLAIYPASILLAWAGTPEELREKWLARIPLRTHVAALGKWALENARMLAVLNVMFGALLGIYTGVLLGTMAARPLWNSAILGPLFLVSGMSTGAAFILLYKLADSERALLSRVDMGLILVEIALIAIWLIGLASGGAAAREAVALFFGGPYTAAFWTLVVALGLVTPFVGELIELRHEIVPGRMTAALVLVGGFALRWIVVYAGQHAGWVSDIALR
jgi:formate-dependent nitrite reductase membrane component NrfD